MQWTWDVLLLLYHVLDDIRGKYYIIEIQIFFEIV